jgi:flagellar basal-body rod modification protein FlgD
VTVSPTSGIPVPYEPGVPSSAYDSTGTTSSTGILAANLLGDSDTTQSAKDQQQMFLQLLVAQLRYQDPMNPTDNSQLIQQEAQMTSLQAMQNLAKQNTQLLSSTMAFGAASMIGKEVYYDKGDGTSATGTVSSVAFGSRGPVLAINGAAVLLTDVLSVNGTPTTTPTDPTDNSGNSGNSGNSDSSNDTESDQ